MVDSPPKSEDTLPALIARLGEDVVTLLDSKLGLLKVEVKEDIGAYMQSGVAFVAGGIVAAVGFALVNVALALFVTGLVGGPPVEVSAKSSVGFLILGLVYVLIGLVLAWRAARRLTSLAPGPAKSVAELERDKLWIRAEAGDA